MTIVTAVRNRAATLARTIESVLAQTWPEVEHVVIDGASNDGTVEVIQRYADQLAHWRSEPDRGISDAFNKGVAAARGDCIGLLNADDWLEPEQIERAVAALRRSAADFVFGDLLYHDAAGRTLFRIRGDPNYARAIDRGMPDVNHPTLLARRAVFERIGSFDPALRFAMDYDWLLRAHRAGFRGTYAPEVVGHMSLAGVSDRDYVRALAEVRDIAIAHGEPGARAWPLYLYRVAKGTTQRALLRTAPAGLYELLRRRVNPSYEPYRPGGRR
ncbi:MAG TPA: glycosyltransferase family 2 protein [Geminicoccaceae bacterium]|nr:glycosyltransferase family 2 protein [Geminicoccaceae bacterium]